MSDYVYVSMLWNVSVYECAYLLYIPIEKYMFHEMYAVTDTTDRTKAQSRFGTLSNLCFFVNNQLDAQFIFFMYISILCLFWAAMCLSSGELIVSISHLVYVTLYR
jgi:adenine-specific DNA methylase